ncbi:peptidoglycan/LPS O-acetylase OafA/YrhL [Actinoplanes lutulentus]|uniref:Acyltransferase-like protein n=1 Tax=Actinoplanes lutulentus TaxID=1287878 RepID=A0A327ZBE9_9ACTN|nr:acyltransferase [Actinoplanes lutulentus]MBB2948837.1 peptidoglycan/LPS O-acetylase OafA/YrhL [Actinoplanes lutulentus]RAK29748.1 acyltransferase-like protein [Actinoplanes lutulentus]
MTAALWTATVAAATPPDRERAVDGLRAIAMLGVVAGHWLVTGLTIGSGGGLRQASPLTAMPGLTPLTWVLQTLGLFFFVSGYAAARGLSRSPTLCWLAGRARRLLPPVAVFLSVWLLILTALRHTDPRTLHTFAKIALSPLWFVLVLGLLLPLTPLVVRAVDRFGAAATLVPLAALLTVDSLRYAITPGMPGWPAYLNCVSAWLVPYTLGVAVARGRLAGPRWGRRLLAAGLISGALLIAAGYPASLVGVPGDGRSNLNPPSLLTAALSAAQIGIALLLWARLNRWLRHPGCWAVVAGLNLTAMTIFLWHQSALLGVTALAGLSGPPDSAGWIVHRMLWLPAVAVALLVIVAFLEWSSRQVRRRSR